MAVVPTSTAIDELGLYVDFASKPEVTEQEATIILTRFALVDEFGTLPDGAWETFNFYGAAAELWKIKAGRAAMYITTNADGQQYSYQQIREACEKQYEYYKALSVTTSITLSNE